MTKTPIEERIEMLLRKAESTDSPAEAESLSAAAEKLMIKNGIDRTMLDLERQSGKPVEQIVIRTIHMSGIYSHEEMMIGYRVAGALGLKAYQHKSDKSNVYLKVIGFESDADDAVALIRSLQVQAAHGMQSWWKAYKLASYYQLTSMEGYVARRSYVDQFGAGAASRIRESRKTVVEEASSGTALVLVDRSKQVADYYNNIPGLRTNRSRRSSDSAGRQAGFTAGREAATGERGLSQGRGISR